MELASRWGVEGSEGSGLPWRKLAFQMFQAAILVNWGDIDPPNGGAVVVYILISMLRDIVEHGHSVPCTCRWGAEFCNWSYAQRVGTSFFCFYIFLNFLRFVVALLIWDFSGWPACIYLQSSGPHFNIRSDCTYGNSYRENVLPLW